MGKNNQSRSDGEMQDHMQEESDRGSSSTPHTVKAVNNMIAEVQMQAGHEKGGKK